MLESCPLSQYTCHSICVCIHIHRHTETYTHAHIHMHVCCSLGYCRCLTCRQKQMCSSLPLISALVFISHSICPIWGSYAPPGPAPCSSALPVPLPIRCALAFCVPLIWEGDQILDLCTGDATHSRLPRPPAHTNTCSYLCRKEGEPVPIYRTHRFALGCVKLRSHFIFLTLISGS